MNNYIKKSIFTLLSLMLILPCCSGEDVEDLYDLKITSDSNFSAYYIVDGGAITVISVSAPSGGIYSAEIDDIAVEKLLEIQTILLTPPSTATLNLMIYKDTVRIVDEEFSYNEDTSNSKAYDYDFSLIEDDNTIDPDTNGTTE